MANISFYEESKFSLNSILKIWKIYLQNIQEHEKLRTENSEISTTNSKTFCELVILNKSTLSKHSSLMSATNTEKSEGYLPNIIQT